MNANTSKAVCGYDPYGIAASRKKGVHVPVDESYPKKLPFFLFWREGALNQTMCCDHQDSRHYAAHLTGEPVMAGDLQT